MHKSLANEASNEAPKLGYQRIRNMVLAILMVFGVGLTGAVAPAFASAGAAVSASVDGAIEGDPASVSVTFVNRMGPTTALVVVGSAETPVSLPGGTLAEPSRTTVTFSVAAGQTLVAKYIDEYENTPEILASWTNNFVPQVDEGDLKQITYCHAAPPNAGEPNQYILITTSVNTFLQEGHGGHSSDIVPAFTWMKFGVQQSFAGSNLHLLHLLNNGCEPPAPVLILPPAAPTIEDPCGVANDRVILPALAEGVLRYDVVGTPASGTVTVTAVLAEGYAVRPGTQLSWTFTFTNEPCPKTPAPAPIAPKVIDKCETKDDTVEIFGAPHWSATLNGEAKAPGVYHVTGTVTVVYTAEAGYADGAGNTALTYVHEFTNVACPVIQPEKPEQPKPEKPEQPVVNKHIEVHKHITVEKNVVVQAPAAQQQVAQPVRRDYVVETAAAGTVSSAFQAGHALLAASAALSLMALAMWRPWRRKAATVTH